MHNTLSQSQYDSELKIILSKWKESPELNVFSDYFKKQWLNSKFSKWQLFNVPVGYAMTNSPIESYNNTIKESFTKRIKHHLKSSVEVFQGVISYESTNQKEFKINPTVKKYMRVQAKSILTNNKLIPTANDQIFLYAHHNKNLGLEKINTVTKTCTCHKYFDKGVCKHLVAACLKIKVFLPGLVQLPKKFQIIRRRKNRQYRDDSRNSDNIDADLIAIAEIIENHAVIVEAEPQVVKKRGRKPKATVDNVNTGRPRLARGALEFDDQPITLRRSQRTKSN